MTFESKFPIKITCCYTKKEVTKDSNEESGQNMEATKQHFNKQDTGIPDTKVTFLTAI
jgi:hypothetical protein